MHLRFEVRLAEKCAEARCTYQFLIDMFAAETFEIAVSKRLARIKRPMSKCVRVILL